MQSFQAGCGAVRATSHVIGDVEVGDWDIVWSSMSPQIKGLMEEYKLEPRESKQSKWEQAALQMIMKRWKGELWVGASGSTHTMGCGYDYLGRKKAGLQGTSTEINTVQYRRNTAKRNPNTKR